jgi:two-component system, LuxR family, response regulator FixJ
MHTISPTVFVIDPDGATRSAIRELVSTINLPCEEYTSGREFFAGYTDSRQGCLVLEVRIPDMSGFQIERRLSASRNPLPMVFLSGQTDVSLAVELMRRGSVHYLQKPLRPLELLNAIQEAIALDDKRRRAWQKAQRIAERIALLTPKEQDVLRMMAEGKPNNAIAESLGVSRRTVEIRRANLTGKLRVKSPMALLRFALAAKRKGDLIANGTAARRAEVRELH